MTTCRDCGKQFDPPAPTRCLECLVGLEQRCATLENELRVVGDTLAAHNRAWSDRCETERRGHDAAEARLNDTIAKYHADLMAARAARDEITATSLRYLTERDDWAAAYQRAEALRLEAVQGMVAAERERDEARRSLLAALPNEPVAGVREAFVAGAAWHEFYETGATIWDSDRRVAEIEAERRFPTSAPSPSTHALRRCEQP